jgi:hypothetical protein
MMTVSTRDVLTEPRAARQREVEMLPNPKGYADLLSLSNIETHTQGLVISLASAV